MKDLLKNKSILGIEKALTTRSICKVEENWFPLDRKLVSNRQNEGFISKTRLQQTGKQNQQWLKIEKNGIH